MLNKLAKTVGRILLSLFTGLLEYLLVLIIIFSIVFVAPYLAPYGIPGIIAIVVYIISIPVIMLVMYRKIESRKSDVASKSHT
jgi:hypothetical protein